MIANGQGRLITKADKWARSTNGQIQQMGEVDKRARPTNGQDWRHLKDQADKLSIIILFSFSKTINTQLLAWILAPLISSKIFRIRVLWS